ncbi:glycine zipper 2TM domain-containing protein [Vibrio sp. Of7-15]|uniref:glycine zipper 2TM domain-containing protein n=1 Tax=Vibrio sp. Of7-15 TaxID=2724879 RepID=UPI001EF19C4D|nr:glycine zipper 2TM domain-containing protein [Vibrio sp. Of7-15]MCG7495940.1 glycine zipper 2TM domain-containing protein [Vibrio sp. Of7-15]
MRSWLLVLLLLPLTVSAAYNRNEARVVNKVVYGEVDSVRYITHQEMVQSTVNGWETLLGAAVGGLIGNQFGDGRGRELATAVGAIAGASVAHQKQNQLTSVNYKLVELLVKTEEGQLVDIVQDLDSNMLFSRGDDVRILYFDKGVRVDQAY